MKKKNSKIQEFNNFTNLSEEWWKPNGKFRILHQILPLRIQYILNNIGKDNIKNFRILDMGCGGGLTCEPLAKLGANVTGIDFIKENIEIAKKHSFKSKLHINYLNQDLDQISLKNKYDVVLILEVIEHMEDWKLLIKKIKNILTPKGKLIISTINKTYLSKIFAILIAENLLKWVPKNTHNYDKLIKHEDLIKELNKNDLKFKNITGMNYHPISREWKLSKDKYSINYFCTAEKI